MNPWSHPGTVAGFVQSPPNAVLMLRGAAGPVIYEGAFRFSL